MASRAVAVDQRTGIVYETEDPGTGVGAGFYRYLPKNPRRLRDGGQLQMLGIRRRPGLDMRKGQTVGDTLAVTWVDIRSPDPDYRDVKTAWPDTVFSQGLQGGGAIFNRLEAAGTTRGRCSSSPPAAATPRTATSTPTAIARVSGRCGSTGRAAATTGC